MPNTLVGFPRFSFQGVRMEGLRTMKSELRELQRDFRYLAERDSSFRLEFWSKEGVISFVGIMNPRIGRFATSTSLKPSTVST